MNKKLNSLLISLITLFILSQFFLNSELLINTFFNSINLLTMKYLSSTMYFCPNNAIK